MKRMQQWRTIGRAVGAVLSVWLLTLSLVAQDKGLAQQGTRLRVTTELVLVNVVVRDKKGNPIANLKKEDFTVFEDGQKQQVSSFDFEDVNAIMTAGAAGPTVSGTTGETAALLGPGTQTTFEAKDRRLMLLFLISQQWNRMISIAP